MTNDNKLTVDELAILEMVRGQSRSESRINFTLKLEKSELHAAINSLLVRRLVERTDSHQIIATAWGMQLLERLAAETTRAENENAREQLAALQARVVELEAALRASTELLDRVHTIGVGDGRVMPAIEPRKLTYQDMCDLQVQIDENNAALGVETGE